MTKVMTPNEIIVQLDKCGVKITTRTLYNFSKWGLVSEPKRGAGYGGKWVEYPPKTIYEAYAAFKLMHGKYSKEIDAPKIPPKVIAIIRKMFRGEPMNIKDCDLAFVFIGLVGIYGSLFREIETIYRDILKEV